MAADLGLAEAQAVFKAVLAMAGPTQALFEAQVASAMGELSDDDLLTVVRDYVSAKKHLDTVLEGVRVT